MDHIVNLLFEAKMLKEIPRSGYHFLGSGKESVAEHSFIITMIAYVISKIEPDVDALKLISMCLLHDLPETRTGDLNYVQKKYVTADENKAVAELTENLTFGAHISDLINEYNDGESKEALLAHDADQLAFILDLKSISDVGNKGPEKWLPHVLKRLKTETGKKIARGITGTSWDAWWLKSYVD